MDLYNSRTGETRRTQSKKLMGSPSMVEGSVLKWPRKVEEEAEEGEGLTTEGEEVAAGEETTGRFFGTILEFKKKLFPR